ncbi:unnamed protein product [Porites lobata]|uniref:Acyltransferase 3 domain-containing protein n=1 Tax=Porites lobata TaxID=104759 RepID=A0ABN8NH67_9CNID|nr:unnamed protein product [Porites lobata]
MAFFDTPIQPLTKAFPLQWGICAPKQCDEHDLTNLVDKFLGFLKLVNITIELSPRVAEAGSKEAKPIYCKKEPEYTTGVIITLTLCGIILSLCLVGTVLDVLISFFKPRPSTVNKSDGFMPIRNVSIATDNDQGPPHVPVFGKHDGISDNSQMIHSIPPEGTVSYSSSLTSFPEQPKEPNVVAKFLLCFSLIQNTNRILSTKVPPGAITSINGMRVLSMWWVILGHCYAFQVMTGLPSNLFTFFGIIKRFTFEAIGNATFSVDSFFFLSGFLVAYLSLRHMQKNNGQLPLFSYYFHRFWRLTPTYMFVLLFWNKLTVFLGEGPNWLNYQSDEACNKYWWTNLLYINNFYPTKFGASCMGWAWYLANDMQFYIIAPAILFMAYRFRLVGMLIIVGVLVGASFITTAIIFAHYDLAAVQLGAEAQAEAAKGIDAGSLTYVKPYCRIAPYLVGMLLGYIVLHFRDWKMPKVRTYMFNVAGWCVAIALALSTLYGEYSAVRKDNPKPFTRAENIIYGTFSRCAWGLALAWVIFACHRGLGGLVDKILSAHFWIPLSRLTYCAYLVHPIVLITYLGSLETNHNYSDVLISFFFTGSVVLSYAAAFIVSVCVEFPMMQLEKLIFKTQR